MIKTRKCKAKGTIPHPPIIQKVHILTIPFNACNRPNERKRVTRDKYIHKGFGMCFYVRILPFDLVFQVVLNQSTGENSVDRKM